MQIYKVDLKDIELLEETVTPIAGCLCGIACSGGMACGVGCEKVI